MQNYRFLFDLTFFPMLKWPKNECNRLHGC